MTTLTDRDHRQVAAWRALWFAVAWLIVAGLTPSSWLIGLPTVALATWASLSLAPPSGFRISLRGLIGFLGYFLRESLHGGWDVAMRTLAPRMRIAPGQTRYTCSLPEGLPVVIFAGCVSLLPGTLSCRFEGTRLALHLLDASESQHAQLQELEKRIAAMFSVSWEAGHV